MEINYGSKLTIEELVEVINECRTDEEKWDALRNDVIDKMDWSSYEDCARFVTYCCLAGACISIDNPCIDYVKIAELMCESAKNPDAIEFAKNLQL